MARSKFCEKLSLYVWFIPYLVLFNYTYRYFKEQQSLPITAFDETTLTTDAVSSNSVHVSAYPLLQTAGKPCHSPNVPLGDSFFSMNRKNVRTSFLCKLKMAAHCGSIEPSEVVDGFWVVCPAYASFQTFIQYRYILHENYKGYIESFGLPFSTIEAIRKDRNQKYLLTRPGNEPYDIQIEFWDDMYIRENFLNVAARKIPQWDYFAWIDTHQVFENVYWWEESIIKMERNASVQLFQYLRNRDLQNVTGPEMLSSIQVSLLQSSFEPAPHFLLGNAFAIRKDLYDKIEYIYDECVASCCDCAWVLASAPKSYVFSYFASFYRYSNQMHKWINRTQDIFKGSRAIVRGTLDHLFHEKNFNYVPMIWKIHDSGFNLTEGLTRDANFTLRIKDENIKKIFEQDTFMTNLTFYVKGNNIDFYAQFVGSMLLSLILTWCVSRRAKKVSQNSN